MPQFTVNPERFDPYKNFRFRLKMDGRYVAGISRMSGLRRTSEMVRHRECDDASGRRLSPGATSFEPITIERGVTHDQDFERWASTVRNPGAAEVLLKDLRKDLTLELADLTGRIVLAYRIYRCWPSEFQGLPNLDANAVSIQRLVLQNQGWECDHAGTEPAEPGFIEPQ